MSGLAWFLAGPFVYIAMVVFVGGAVGKILFYLKMPRHFRWDLYPVPHQGPSGSKYQKVDFYKHEREVLKLHEIEEMAQEVFFIKRAFLNNPTVWKGSFPFHAGLYLLTAWFVLLVLGGFLEMAGIKIGALGSPLAVFIYYTTIFTGIIGFVSGLFGALYLLYLRCTDEGMRDMSTFVNYLSLYIMLFLFGSGLFAWFTVDMDFSLIRSHMVSLIVFSPEVPGHWLVTLEMFAFGVFLLFLPFSRMLHFAAKYFFYHNIMWDDEPMKPYSEMAKDIGGYFHYKIDWTASHLKKSGSWLEQATQETQMKAQEVKANNEPG